MDAGSPVPEGDRPRPRVVAIVAAKDRADTVGPTVATLLALDVVEEVLVVDDGSTDATATVALAAGARVLRLPRNRGKGAAVAAGVRARPDADAYLLIDADVGPTAGAAAALVGPVAADAADMTVGVLPPAGRTGGFGTVMRLARAGIRRAAGSTVQAPLSGQRCVRGPLMRGLDPAPRFGLEVGLTIDAVRRGARVVEVPVHMEHRPTGRSAAGFAHRARQGADIARALWPRLTTPALRIAVIVIATGLVAATMVWSGSRWEVDSVPATTTAERVVVIGVPGLGWDSLGSGSMPALDRVAQDGAVAAMNVRTRSPRPDVIEAYAALGAGSRVQVDTDPPPVERESDGSLRVTTFATLVEGSGRDLASRPGSLGEALHAAGRRTAAVGPGAAVAVMDGSGRVDSGDPAPMSLIDAARRALGDGADVVVVDTSGATGGEADALIGALVDPVPPATLVLVVGLVPPAREWRLAPVVAAGPGVVGGYLHSPATRRPGLVTLTDMAPTVLAALGGPVPPEMGGSAWRFRPVSVDLGDLAAMDRRAAWRESLFLPVAIGFVVVWLAVALAGVVLAVRGRLTGPGGRILRVMALAVAAFPLATFALRVLPGMVSLGRSAIVVLVALCLGIGLLATRARRHELSGLAWILGATLAVILVDVAGGARLQSESILGYSPHTANRFYGLGNVTFAVMAGAAILFAALHVERAPRRGEALVTAGAILGLTMVADGAPGLGNDVGGILTLVPVFGVTMLALAGRRVRLRHLSTAAIAGAVVVALFAAVDLARPEAARSHLGRTVSDMLEGNTDPWDPIVRRARLNLGRSAWPWALPVMVAGGLYLLSARRSGESLMKPGSPRRVGVVMTLVVGLVGFALNDSGAVVAGMVLIFVGPLVLLAAVAQARGPVQMMEPAPRVAASTL